MDLSTFTITIAKLAAQYAPRFLLAIITLVVGLWLVRKVVHIAERSFKAQKVDVSLAGFLQSLISIALKILLCISVASMIGIQMTSFIAILGAAGFAVGMALQGSLSNFAGGVLILFFKPFKVGDFIEAAGHSGNVHKIEIFCTTLKTADNKTIIIPNGDLSNSSSINYSTEKTRRVDCTFGISYDDDIKKARKVLLKLIEKDERILKDPEPVVLVKELGDSAVNLTCRMWTKTEDYWDVFFDMQEHVKVTFDKEKISFPYPHQEVYMREVK